MSVLTVLLLPTILGLGSIYLMMFFWKRWRLISKLSWVPGPPGLPILGNYFDVIAPAPEVGFEIMKTYMKKYGKTYKLWIGTTPVIHSQDLDIIQAVFKFEENVRRPALYRMIRHFIGGGILFGEGGDKWRVVRRHLSESFHTDILDKHLQPLSKEIKSLINLLEKEASNSKPVDLIKFFKPCFLDVSLTSVTGIEMKSLNEPSPCPYLDAIETMSDIVMARLFSPLLKINGLFYLSHLKKLDEVAKNTVDSFVNKVVSRRRNTIKIQNEEKKRNIIIDAMLDIHKVDDNISMDDVNAQVSNHIFASYDTLSTLSSYLLFMLANYPKIQDEVLKEINTFVPNILTEGISSKDTNNLRLLDRCVKETLRMYPPAPLIGRSVVKPITTKDGTIPVGVEVYINMFNYHMNEEVYPNPYVFDPDRFLPENLSKRHPLSWMPFGLGPRICIGQKQAMIQAKAAVAMVLKKFIVKPFERPEDLKLIANVVLKSRDGIRVYLHPREN